MIIRGQDIYICDRCKTKHTSRFSIKQWGWGVSKNYRNHATSLRFKDVCYSCRAVMNCLIEKEFGE